MKINNNLLAVCAASLVANGIAHANMAEMMAPQSKAPIGVMGAHMHKEGKWMVSYRFMHMEMSGMLQGSDSISPEQIATQVANPFANPPMSPPTVRVVPDEMTSQMHMVGLMYAPTNNLTLMAMLNYLDKSMDLITFAGGMGDTRLGEFSTATSGLADSSVGGMYRLYDSDKHKLHANLNWIIPIGSIDEEDDVLTPMNMRMTMRLPYGMQIGTGSNQLQYGLTYNGKAPDMSWGAQGLYNSVLDDNDEGYRYGDMFKGTAWYAYRVLDKVSTSIRLSYYHQENIDGMDSMIMAPVTTANPNNYGFERIDLGLGVNTVLGHGHRFALEWEMPLDTDVNGVQMEMDYMVTLGYQHMF